MAKDVNIHIKAEGGDQAKQQLDGVSQSAKGVGDKTKQGAKEGAAGMEELKASTNKADAGLEKLNQSLKSLGTKALLTAVGAVTLAIRAQTQAIQEHAEATSKAQQRLLRLQFLGSYFEEKPELRKEVAAYSEFGRRPFEDVADAWYNLRSKGAGLSEQQQQSILREALELGRIDPSAPLDMLVDMFSLYAKQSGIIDANQIQNVLQQTIREAGGGTGDVAKYMPQFLPIGMKGGLSAAQTAGLWSYVTTQLAEPSIATTGLTAMFMGLQGKGTPEAAKMLEQLGITPEMDFLTKIAMLSERYKAGTFGLAEAEQIGTRTGAGVLLSILKNPQAMMQTIASVTAADRPGVDITADMIKKLMGVDELAKAEDEKRRLEVKVENIKKMDKRALDIEAFIKEYELHMRERGHAEGMIDWMMAVKRGLLSMFPGRLPADIRRMEKEFDVDSPLNGLNQPVINNFHNDTNNYPRVGEPVTGPRSSPEDIY